MMARVVTFEPNALYFITYGDYLGGHMALVGYSDGGLYTNNKQTLGEPSLMVT